MTAVFTQTPMACLAGLVGMISKMVNPLPYPQHTPKAGGLDALDAAALRDMGFTRKNADFVWLKETIVLRPMGNLH